VAAVPSGLSLTPLTIIKNNKMRDGRPGFDSWKGQEILLYSTMYSLALEPT
jgi:hypothetical protein